MHNGKGQREHEPCNGDYLGHEKAAYHLPDYAGGIAGGQCNHGGNTDLQIVQAWGGGCKSLLPFSFTGNPAASIAHNMRGMLENVGFSFIGSRGRQSCRIVANSGIFA